MVRKWSRLSADLDPKDKEPMGSLIRWWIARDDWRPWSKTRRRVGHLGGDRKMGHSTLHRQALASGLNNPLYLDPVCITLEKAVQPNERK